MKYQLLAFDLDGTLLNTHMHLSDENSRALSALAARGVTVVPNTGRTLAEIPDFLLSHPAFRYVIHSDGAVIFDRLTDRRYYECLTQPLLKTVIAILRKYDTLITYRTGGVSYLDACFFNDASLSHYQLSKYYQGFIYATNRPQEDFDAFCDGHDTCEMMCVFFHDKLAMTRCREELSALGGLIIASSEPHNLEIFSARAGKGNALLRLADILGIPHAETCAIGDSENDVDMIRRAGLGLCMQNGNALLKRTADAVLACTNDEHVARFLLNAYESGAEVEDITIHQEEDE